MTQPDQAGALGSANGTPAQPRPVPDTTAPGPKRRRSMGMWDRDLVRRSLRESLRKLDPRTLTHNP
ncbi:MAG: hypothetical protein M0Z42_07095, partial [Actinomycetota bacterium]|nr:hypothetical protein [Actinomycetota bacterium]